ncbi:MAG: dicarboxylate/amino acid:cation symporter [Pirellulales bacterium]|nr:dicarboxylate/amino acid:cation symporter [Pirellulales bacterium]
MTPIETDNTLHVAGSGPRRRIPLHTKILLGLVIGALVGLAANWVYSRPNVPVLSTSGVNLQERQDTDANHVDDRLDWFASRVADPLGRVFLRLVLMVVLPLVFSALSLGVLELGDVRRLGRVGLKTLGYTAILSLSAVTIGLILVNWIEPGKQLSAEKRAALQAPYKKTAETVEARASQAKSLGDILLDMIPENPLQEMSGAIDGTSKGNGMLSVMFFALVFGVALSVSPERTQTLVRVLEGLFDVSMTVIGFAMRIAPVAVGCLVFAVTARLGLDILQTLFWYVATVLLGLGLQLLVVYPAVLALLARRSPLTFFRDISEAVYTAFGTSSSNATLPTSLRVAREKLGIPREVGQFVLTVGATGNQNGTALYEGVTVLFLAQVYSVDLSLLDQIKVVLMSVLAGIGTAGVPGGSLPLVVIVLRTVKVPAEGIGIILGVDRLLDMCRTVLNVVGDLAIAACVSRGEPASEPESSRVS